MPLLAMAVGGAAALAAMLAYHAWAVRQWERRRYVAPDLKLMPVTVCATVYLLIVGVF